MGRVLIPQAVAPEGVAFLEERGHAVVHGTGSDVETIVREVSGCDAILARTARFPAEALEAEPRLRVIARHGVGYDNIAVERATELGIQVTFTPEANAGSVAEMTVALMLAITRNIVRADNALRAGDFAIRNREHGVDLIGKTLLLVGVGRIGRLVAQKAHAGLGMRVIGFDPAPGSDLPDCVEMAGSLDEALGRAHVVSLHLPSTPETRGSFDA
ncbi:MAG: NAD(P)-dependent oxidoreductase, partial [Spirochaetota bacterium]